MMNLSEVSEFKKYLMEANETVLHFHDTCGGQSFSLSKTSPETISSIQEYLSPKGYTAIFASDNMSFRLHKD
jgi:hypothetical protein